MADPANGNAAHANGGTAAAGGMAAAASWAAEPGVRGWWLRLAPGTRTRLKLALLGGVVVVALVGVLLARWLSVENTERDLDLALIEAQARGDVQGMLNRLHGCGSRPQCVATVRANASNPRLLRRGAVKILQLESATSYSLAGATGETRVAWTVIGKLPVVQCVKVQRTGNPVSGITVRLLALSAPIENEGPCGGRTRSSEREEAEVKSLNGP